EQLLARLEAISRERPDRVLRLRGTLRALPPEAGREGGEDPAAAAAPDEPCELVIYRGFSSSTTHPTAFDPDQPALPETTRLISAEILQALRLAGPQGGLLAGPGPVAMFLEPGAWP
ncbi:MAG: hypothetical protein WCP63_10055, partial [Cyanobium sp. ELA712]